MFVAVVARQDDPLWSGRAEGDLGCFVAVTKEEAAGKALAAAIRWSNASYKKYQVLVGELTERATIPVELTPIDSLVF